MGRPLVLRRCKLTGNPTAALALTPLALQMPHKGELGWGLKKGIVRLSLDHVSYMLPLCVYM